jgi:hypothetical protein
MTSDSREGASSGQDKSPIHTANTRPSHGNPLGFCFEEEITSALHIEQKTLLHWVKCGMKRPDRKKLGMKRQPYLWGLVFDFLASNLEQ